MDTQENGMQLSDEQLDQVSGGGGNAVAFKKTPPPCPNCGSTNVTIRNEWVIGKKIKLSLHCNNCQSEWDIELDL